MTALVTAVARAPTWVLVSAAVLVSALGGDWHYETVLAVTMAWLLVAMSEGSYRWVEAWVTSKDFVFE